MRNEPLSWIIIAALLAAGLTIVFASRAECEWCYSDVCYSDAECGGGCQCITLGADPLGTCVGGLDDE